MPSLILTRRALIAGTSAILAGTALAFGYRPPKPVWHITRAAQYDDGAERWFNLSSGFKGALEPADWACPERNLPELTRKIRSLA